MPTSLSRTPTEILKKIVLLTVLDNPLGPPTELYALSLTCRAFRNAVSLNCDDMYTSLFEYKFDFRAPAGRYGGRSLLECQTKRELQRRFIALRCFRNGYLYDPFLPEALWIAYLMMLEDDGLNSAQLHWAHCSQYLEELLIQRLYEDVEDNNGWPIENETTALAISVFWLLSSHTSIQAESPESRNAIMDLLGPYVLAAFRYPCSIQIDCQFANPGYDEEYGQITFAHGTYPPSRPDPRPLICFGDIVKTLHIPVTAISAIPAFFSRLETRVPEIPPHLAKNRSEANAAGRIGPTREDVEHFRQQCNTPFTNAVVSLPKGLPHVDHTSDWLRLDPSSLRAPYTKAYIPGTLAGRWQGSTILPFYDEYQNWLKAPNALSPTPDFVRAPFYCTLREHVCYSLSKFSPNAQEDDVFNSWWPHGSFWFDNGNGIEISDQSGFSSFYETFDRDGGAVTGTGASRCADAVDVIITGTTDKQHGDAWGFYNYFGRVRLSDGLIVLYRQSVSGLGDTLLRGYVTSSRNFVGRYRGMPSSNDPAEWEAPFSLGKADQG